MIEFQHVSFRYPEGGEGGLHDVSLTIPDGQRVLLCGRSDIASATLPGYAANFTSGSYYVLDAGGVADIVNRYLNPYEKEVQAAELYIRNG